MRNKLVVLAVALVALIVATVSMPSVIATGNLNSPPTAK